MRAAGGALWRRLPAQDCTPDASLQRQQARFAWQSLPGGVRKTEFMKSFLKLLLLAPVAVVIIAFAIGNRHSVKVVADPTAMVFAPLHVEAPLYLVVLVSLMVGTIVGGVAAWMKQGKYRKAARTARADSKKLEAETERLRSQVSTLAATENNITAAYTSRPAA